MDKDCIKKLYNTKNPTTATQFTDKYGFIIQEDTVIRNRPVSLVDSSCNDTALCNDIATCNDTAMHNDRSLSEIESNNNNMSSNLKNNNINENRCSTHKFTSIGESGSIGNAIFLRSRSRKSAAEISEQWNSIEKSELREKTRKLILRGVPLFIKYKIWSYLCNEDSGYVRSMVDSFLEREGYKQTRCYKDDYMNRAEECLCSNYKDNIDIGSEDNKTVENNREEKNACCYKKEEINIKDRMSNIDEGTKEEEIKINAIKKKENKNKFIRDIVDYKDHESASKNYNLVSEKLNATNKIDHKEEIIDQKENKDKIDKNKKEENCKYENMNNEKNNVCEKRNEDFGEINKKNSCKLNESIAKKECKGCINREKLKNCQNCKKLIFDPDLESSWYNILKTKECGYEHQIHVDIQRTFRKHVLFSSEYGTGQCRLFHLLVAFANLFPEIGYCQGMSSFAGLVLMYFPEKEGFVFIVNLVHKNRLQTLFDKNLSLLPEILFIQFDILKRVIPTIERHLKNNVDLSVFVFGWYLTLFSRFDIAVSLRLWDLFVFYDFTVFLIGVAAILRVFKDKILDLEGERLMHFLTSVEGMRIDEERMVRYIKEYMKVLDLDKYRNDLGIV